MVTSDEKAMRRALVLARKGYGRTYPNPMVGAVIVKDGEIIGEGWHHGPGQPHAEVEALRSCTTDPKGATLLVTLEPCNHFGRTPPCTEAIIRAGIGKVRYAVADPNPGVAGGGAQRLREAGIPASEGIGRTGAVALNQAYFHHCRTGRPWVIMKAGMSLDGKIALADGESQWITGMDSGRQVHRLRSQVGAVLVGIGTALRDNPHLTCRLKNPRSYRQPFKVLLDSKLRVTADSFLVGESPDKLVVFCTTQAPPAKEAELTRRKVRVFRQDAPGEINPEEVLRTLGKLGIQSVLIEGGHYVYASFVEAGLVDEYYLFYAPFWIGGDAAVGVLGGKGLQLLAEKAELKLDSVRRCGEDLLVHAYRKKL